MLVLWQRADMPVGGLGNALQLESGTLSPLLKRLEATGLITRTRQAVDERSVLVSPTPAGHELESRVAEVQRRAAQAIGLSRAELAELRDTLNRLTERLRAVNRARSA